MKTHNNWIYVKGKAHRKGFLLNGIKRVELKDKAKEMGYSEGYLMERLHKMKSVEDALNREMGIVRRLGNGRCMKKNPVISSDTMFNQMMKALSMCGNREGRGL